MYCYTPQFISYITFIKSYKSTKKLFATSKIIHLRKGKVALQNCYIL